MSVKPDHDKDDPEDVAIYEHAKLTIGDYKLKSGKDYVIPENQRMTATKKRQELLLLRNEILVRKQDFNKHLLSLRDYKTQLIGKV